MKRFKLLLLVCSFPLAGFGQGLSATEILEKTIAYHDPNNEWSMMNRLLIYSELRPDGSVRTTTAHIDNSTGYFRLNRGDEQIVGMKMDSCFVEKGSYDCERAEMMRNYYIYLWGLPMKLKDAGTPLSNEVTTESYEGTNCYMIRVNYEKDTWFFYIDQDTYRMMAYKFYQDKELSKGELIRLEEEIKVQSMKIPRKRSWYVLPGNTFLGTDILDESRIPE